jgi:tetratricopeptide (TPR) repeat protein
VQPYVLYPPSGSDPADEWLRLGVEAQCAGKLPDAERHYRHALRLDPRHALATQNLGILFAQQGNVNEALLTIERASLFDGDHALIYSNRALMALEAERIDEALAVARKGVEKVPCKETRLALALVSATAGLAELAVEQYREILKEDPKHPAAGPNSCFRADAHQRGAEGAAKAADKWYAQNRYDRAEGAARQRQDAGPVLRVGYVSGDFKCHSAAMIFGQWS